MSELLLSVANLSLERGGRQVLRNVSLTLQAGDIVCVAGRNGAGKSTLLRAIAGLLPANEGAITFGRETEERRGAETLHYVGYEEGLKPSLTVVENLMFWMAFLQAERESDEAEVRRVLDAFGIGRLAAVPAAYLSAGQKRRVALAKLRLAPRPIWLLDEPFLALDREAQSKLNDLLSAHTQDGGAVLLASHQSLPLPHARIDLDALNQTARA